MSHVPTVADAELEAAIDMELTLCIHTPCRDESARAFERACHLHAQRRPEMVELIERRLGLRK